MQVKAQVAPVAPALHPVTACGVAAAVVARQKLSLALHKGAGTHWPFTLSRALQIGVALLS